MKDKKLTSKEKIFVKEYLIDLNATQAAIRAGYSQKSARITACRMLTKANIQNALTEAMKKRSEKIEVTADYVLGSLIELTERCMQRKPVMVFDYKNKELVQLEDENGQGVWQFDSAGANKALRNIGEHLGLFKKVFASDPDNPLFPAIKIVRADKQKKESDK